MGGEDVDIAAYFTRIGYRGPATATVDTLHGISVAHVTRLPFNNLDILLGRSIPLDLGALERKIVREGRGGYCFEQNGYLLRVLRQLGFRVTPLGGRARLQTPREVMPPRTHMCLKVDIAGEPWLFDVGFGALSLSAAIRLVPDIEQRTPHETRRITLESGRYFHQARLGDSWNDAYEFTLDELHPIDQEVGNWWTSAHPASRFRTRLIVARAEARGDAYRSTTTSSPSVRRTASGKPS